jgi:hypothetical protein
MTIVLKTLNFDIQREHLYENDSVIVATLKGEDEDAPKRPHLPHLHDH